MKYKKRYNFIICFMLLIIVSSATFFFCYPKVNSVESEGNQELIDINNGNNSNGSENVSEQNKVTFNNFSTAIRHAYNYLEKTDGYKSMTYGKFSLNIKNLVNIEQTIKLTSEINNKDNSSRSTVCTYGDGKIKNNTGYEFVKIDDEVMTRKSRDRVEGGFNYEGKEVSTFSTQQFLDEWSILPEEAFTRFPLSKVINGNMTKNAKQYILTFTIDSGEMLKNNIVFVKRFFDNSENSKQINPSFTNMSIELTLDEYGRPIKAKYNTSFYDLNLYGVGIPLSGLTGKVSYTQQFYAYGQKIQIDRI